MAKIGVVGEKDFAQLYRAVGLDVFYAEDGEAVSRRVHRMREKATLLFSYRKSTMRIAAKRFRSMLPPCTRQSSRSRIAAAASARE